jgi:hypothetical protein
VRVLPKNHYLCPKKNILLRFMKGFIISSALIALLLCSCHRNKADLAQQAGITAEMAYEAVNNYCHSEYDWSIATENPSMMSVTMGEETENEYKVIFRSYTGALVNFYVDKSNGMTRMVESVPTLDVDSVVDTIDIMDYLEKKE